MRIDLADHASVPLVPGGHDDIDNRVLPKILRLQAERLGAAPFIDICGRTASFEEMFTLSSRLANGFRALGVAQFDRVAMVLPNGMDCVLSWFALSALGAIEVPINPELKGDFLCHNIGKCGASLVIAHVSVLGEIARVEARLPSFRTLVVVDGDAADARAAGVRVGRVVAFGECLSPRADLDPVDVHYSHPMAILYTSGTTGPAKGALMSHHHCYSWAAAMAMNLGYTGADSYFSPLPLFHTDAQMFGVYLPLIHGTRATLTDRFSASRFWGEVRASGATATNLLGAMAAILMKMPESADDADNPVRVAQCIPMVPDKAAFERRFAMRLVTGYGQTETSFVTLDTVDEAKPGACGRPHPDWEVAVVDEADNPLPPGTVGEIVARPRKSWTMFSGYYGDEARTVQTLRNLWYHSGDAGFMDEDGWLYFRHRLNEAIRRRGENISAYEVEHVAEAHADIVESAAFGVPSEFTEEDIMVVAMRREGSVVDAAGLLAHFRAHAPRHMVPRYIEIVDAPLPRTPTEKIARSELKKKGIGPGTFDRGER